MLSSRDSLEESVLKNRNALKPDKLDMSFGEIINLYEDGELIISPDFQRAFRWDREKQTSFIESILLGIPIPPIFVAEDSDGKWELVDGLQRVSTILSFFGVLKNVSSDKNNLVLENAKLVKELNEFSAKSMPTKLMINIKRTYCRVEILKTDVENSLNMKYELFKRLNTNAVPLTPQEIRNAIFYGEFNSFIKELANLDIFIELIKPTKKQSEEMYCEELVLRFFAFKYSLEMPNGVSNYLDYFMEKINTKKITFNYKDSKENFIKLINFTLSNLSRDIFIAKNGQFTKNLFDSIMITLDRYFDNYANNSEEFLKKVNLLKEDEIYNQITTKKRESRTKDRINRALEIFG